MANPKSPVGIVCDWINLEQLESIVSFCKDVLELDNDLTTNVEYFREDTISLGFESEADRIISEIKNEYEGHEIIERVCQVISDQEYYGECILHWIEDPYQPEKVVMSFIYGGHS